MDTTKGKQVIVDSTPTRRTVNVFTPSLILESLQAGRQNNYCPKSVNVGKVLNSIANDIAKQHGLDGVSHLVRLGLLSIPEIKAKYDETMQASR